MMPPGMGMGTNPSTCTRWSPPVQDCLMHATPHSPVLSGETLALQFPIMMIPFTVGAVQPLPCAIASCMVCSRASKVCPGGWHIEFEREQRLKWEVLHA
eukprot:6637645-Alexandrium_andersonii.AAC.1